ncbi:MAG: hypothetical protein E7425_04115 [Ruminococcaceae bacterium]|nr:hypothetical protein [Oscillospiraceae bacterium]
MMKKRGVSFLLTFVLLLGLLTAPARAYAPTWSLSTLDGGTVTQDSYRDRVQLLVFYRAAMNDGSAVCSNSARLLRELAQSSWISDSRLKVVAMAVDGADDTAAFKSAFAPNCGDIVFALGGSNLMWNIVGYGQSVTFGVCAIVKDGEVKEYWDGCYSAQTCKQKLAAYVDFDASASASLSGSLSSGTVSYQVKGAPSGARLIAASFNKSGRLLDVRTASVSGSMNGTVSGLKSGTSYRLFLVDRSFVPQCGMVTLRAGDDQPATRADQLSVGGRVYTLGMTASELTSLAGTPAQTLASTDGITWYVYGTETYLDFLLAGVYNGKVVSLASGGKAFSWMGYSAGAKNVTGTNGVKLYTDKNDDSILHAVRLNDTNGLPSGYVTGSDALRGESIINFHMTNAFRVYHGLSPFVWNDAAAEAARLHSADMAQNNYFSHDSQDGRSMTDRMEAQGVRWYSAGENIAAGRSNGIDCYDGWVNSAGHRSNMLTSFTYLGVGYAYNSGSRYRFYMTQDFFSGSSS